MNKSVLNIHPGQHVSADHSPRSTSQCGTFTQVNKSVLTTHPGQQVSADHSPRATGQCWPLNQGNRSVLTTQPGQQVSADHSPRATKSVLTTGPGQQVSADHSPGACPPCCRPPHPGTVLFPLWCAPGLTWARCGRTETAALPLASATPWTGDKHKAVVAARCMRMHGELPYKLTVWCLSTFGIWPGSGTVDNALKTFLFFSSYL